MSLTPNSSASAYASGADFVARFDWRLIGDLVADDNVQVQQSAVPGNVNLMTALASASGELEAACLVGGRYQPADLAALAGVSGEYLKDIVCGLALAKIRDRRGIPSDDDARVKAARDRLDQLREGVGIFSFAEAEKAGLPTNSFMSPSDISRLNLLSSVCRRALGSRTNQLPRF